MIYLLDTYPKLYFRLIKMLFLTYLKFEHNKIGRYLKKVLFGHFIMCGLYKTPLKFGNLYVTD